MAGLGPDIHDTMVPLRVLPFVDAPAKLGHYPAMMIGPIIIIPLIPPLSY
jgi:hypothetical protein